MAEVADAFVAQMQIVSACQALLGQDWPILTSGEESMQAPAITTFVAIVPHMSLDGTGWCIARPRSSAVRAGDS